MTPDKQHRKCAGVIGEVLKSFHPHGDQSVYDALVRMAQDFSLRYPLIDGHGNFGSIDPNPPAAYRYTEARLARPSMDLLADIDKETVDFVPNFDSQTEEPVVLPGRLPQLLVNGSSGIAVGMATNIPPHNLGEICDAVDQAHRRTAMPTTMRLIDIVKGPDFPTGGVLLGREAIRQAYKTGRGSVAVRGARRDRRREGQVPHRDHRAAVSDHDRTRDAIDQRRLSREAHHRHLRPQRSLQPPRHEDRRRPAAHRRRPTSSSTSSTSRRRCSRRSRSTCSRSSRCSTATARSQPTATRSNRRCSRCARCSTTSSRTARSWSTRRTRYDLRKAEERAHLLEGFRIALDNIDEVIKIMRDSDTVETARDHETSSDALLRSRDDSKPRRSSTCACARSSVSSARRSRTSTPRCSRRSPSCKTSWPASGACSASSASKPKI